VRQLVALAEVQQLAHAALVGDLAQEVLLARGAEEVVVAVAVADVVERVGAHELLVARLHVDRRVVLARRRRRVVVVVAPVDVDVDAADVVDRALEAVEVDVMTPLIGKLTFVASRNSFLTVATVLRGPPSA